MKTKKQLLLALGFIGLLITGCSQLSNQLPWTSSGQDGISVVSINKASSEGLVDTYTIIYSDGHTSTFEVTNGADGQSIKGDTGEDGHTPFIVIGENGNWYIDGVDTGFSAQGIQGETGADGTCVHTGSGSPESNFGKNGDSYIDLDTWDYFVKNENIWEKVGNIKGSAGEIGDTGISVINSYIDENGDLIVLFSNNETVNAGHLKDVGVYTVKFYCDDLLVDTQLVKHGDKIELPVLEDFTVKHWYLDKDFEYEWLWYGCLVTEDLTLYGDYVSVIKSISFDKTANIAVDEYGYGSYQIGDKEICVSKADATSDYLTILEDRGILFTKQEIGYIDGITINISEDEFASARVYFGNNPLSFEHSSDLVSGINNVNLLGAEYFTIQNSGSNPIKINSLIINYSLKTRFFNESLPTVVVNTINSQEVTSKTTYVDCNVSTIGSEKDVSDLKAQIKLRGNTTATCPKKPYRIKLSKKNSLFGYAKAKNWVLLADYMDGSKMHNYSALKFAKMIRGEDSFGVDPLHVNLVLNGENVGIYEFGEHIEAKEGRLNIEQENIWEKSFEDINFYIERDSSTAQDTTEIEGTTYFRVNMENYSPSQYVFALKYPEKEDFEEELEGGEINPHEEEFQAFFDSLKAYITDICHKFVAYSQDTSKFSNVASSVDMESLAVYGVVDQVFRESDHGQKSFKMYRSGGGLLKFGPNWDYDSCTYGLPFLGTYVLDPFTSGWNHFESAFFGEKWGYMLYNDIANGRPLFKNIWDNISSEMITSFIDEQYKEMKYISFTVIEDCDKWMHNQYYSVLDNQLYYWKWIETQLPFLKEYYS